MSEEIKEILELLKTDMIHIRLFKEDRDKLLDYITNLQQENERLKDLCDKYEEEHKTTFETWQQATLRNKRAIRRIAIVHMDRDTSVETDNALDYVLQALLEGDSDE